MNRTAIFGLAALGALAVLVRCGSSKGDTELSVKVGSIATAVAARAARPSRVSVPTDAVQSTTKFAMAKVDGIKLTLNSIQALKSGANEATIVTFSGGKEVEIAPGADNNVAITETAFIDSGTYQGIKARYANSYKVKAFCRTANWFVYTSASGIKTAALTPGAMPSDYDYYSYPFAEVTTATSATGGAAETMAQTDGSYTITKGSSLSMAILFDPSYLITCYDGTGTLASNTDALGPFNWSNNNGIAQSSFFPDGSANFGMGYVPLFIWVSSSASEALPTAETYASSTDASKLNAPINFKNVNVTSFAFRADGSLLDVRTRIAGGSTELYQFYSGSTVSSSTYSFYNGEWKCEASYTNCGPIQDRQVTGFTRTASPAAAVSTSTYTDGPDCGKSCIDPNHTDWGNRCRTCLGSSQTMSWKQLVR